jgi:hypothetical protein
MIYISDYEVVNTEKYKLMRTFYKPFDVNNGSGKTEEEMKAEGILLSITEQDVINVKRSFIEGNPPPAKNYEPVMYYNPVTQQLFFEYEETAGLQEQLQTEEVIGTLLFESATDKAKIAELETAQGDLLMEIAMLKMGGTA